VLGAARAAQLVLVEAIEPDPGSALTRSDRGAGIRGDPREEAKDVTDGTDPVTYQVADGVAWLTIDRPRARNALSKEVRDGLWEGARRFVADDSAAVLVLTGTGEKAFCAGGDLKEMADTSLQAPPPDFLPQFGRNIDVPKPTIAAVNGVAFAGGFLLAQQCDLVVAAEHARFAVTEVKVGRGSPWAAPLSWLVPPRVALEILLTGDPLDARRAYEVGLVNRVVPIAELREFTQELARSVAANAPLSVRAGKRTAYLSAHYDLEQAYDRAEEIWAPVYRSRDAQEGPAAFRDKRTPVWKGE
jgi:enoyl-CoA hydratase/carnithine racemase